jgi:hypothetical protein
MLKEYNDPSAPLLSIEELERRRTQLFEKRKELTKEINKEIADVEAQLEELDERKEKPKKTCFDRVWECIYVFICITFGLAQLINLLAPIIINVLRKYT